MGALRQLLSKPVKELWEMISTMKKGRYERHPTYRSTISDPNFVRIYGPNHEIVVNKGQGDMSTEELAIYVHRLTVPTWHIQEGLIQLDARGRNETIEWVVFNAVIIGMKCQKAATYCAFAMPNESVRMQLIKEHSNRKKSKQKAMKKRKQKARHKIFSFLQEMWWRKKEQRRFQAKKQVAAWAQRTWRGTQIRNQWSEALQARLVCLKNHERLWAPSKALVEKHVASPQQGQGKVWASLLESLDFVISSYGEEHEETSNILIDATDKALQGKQVEHETHSEDDAGQQQQIISTATNSTAMSSIVHPEDDTFNANHTQILYTESVKKWLQGPAGGRYRQLFVKRIKQLSSGERSRILAKRLKGSSTKITVYETYLEQKSGKRILWTMKGNDLLVWYVANHDNVSRLAKQIEHAHDRQHRRLLSTNELVKGNSEARSCSFDSSSHERRNIGYEIVLDPLGNTPMKLFEVSSNAIDELASQSWTPRLRLTKEERDIVETKGAVLLLGRSGTGKTVCMASRMDHDQQQLGRDPSFNQLFVARSPKLCAYVESIVENTGKASFETYDGLKQRLEQQLPCKEGIRCQFPVERRMRFDTFKREVYNGEQGIDPGLVWTCIQSFIKGSIEATTKPSDPRAISPEEFLDTEVFSSGRCSLTVDQRKMVYPIYQRYEQFLQDKGMWDDCDRILSLLLRLEHCKTADREKLCSIKTSNIYVDEVQDYTQAECLLFFYLCDGPDRLFLAGDPAQNVVQGVEFRFQDIRSVHYHIAKDKKAVIRKPKKVHVNFRSHAGILKIAASVLKCMIDAFPKSAEDLGVDHGVFVGPRPCVFKGVDIESLHEMLQDKMKGAIVLVHDSRVEYWKETLQYPLIRSIRQSKGLEFKHVIILDFFGDLGIDMTSSVEKAWCDLLVRAETDGLSSNCPEIERHLKLLYTAITRSIERLFFVETKETKLVNAFVRWLATTTTTWHRQDKENDDSTDHKPLATKDKLSDVQTVVMTKDEALQAGLQLATEAEMLEQDDLSASNTLLNQATYYFDLANEPVYRNRAQVHLESIHFRTNLPPLPTDKEKEAKGYVYKFGDLEVRAAGIVEKLFREGMFAEGSDLCLSLLPYLPSNTSQRLRDSIIITSLRQSPQD